VPYERCSAEEQSIDLRSRRTTSVDRTHPSTISTHIFTARRLYKSFGVKGLIIFCQPRPCRQIKFLIYTGRFIMFSVITNIYNKKTKGPTLMELLTATGKQKGFFDN
jgi:hypothetical protein